jgi:predicted unusual protein kinase regulating ubiquinone biosynthesis (AarF/ABC1/UbiB family)
MDPSRLRARYRHIMTFFARLTASFIFWEVVLPRLGLRAVTRRTRSRRLTQIAAQFRALAIRMGGVMIKVGQFLSARADVLPVEITEELSELQDEVPPEDFAAIRALAETELGAPLEEKFERFEPEPLAAASLGQVHRARMQTDEEGFRDVVVKIQRPFIEQLIDVDFNALHRVAGWMMRYGPIRRRADVRALVSELESTVQREIDYLSEGANAETFRRNFAEARRIHVPRVVWSRTTKRVLTLENVYAIKITEYDAITAAGIDRAEVARILFKTYLKQIFEDGFFHADPHPGNLFVTPRPATGENGTSWQLTFVDFGMVGRVPEHLSDGLREMIIGVGTRKASRVVGSYQTLGVLLPSVGSGDLKLLEEAGTQLFDRFWGMSMGELRNVDHRQMMQFAMQFRELMYEMPFQLPHNLLLLGRTVAILSGMCTGLDPNFNVWIQLAPYAKKLVREEGTANWEIWIDEIGELLRQLIALPAQTGRVLARLERGELNVNVPSVNRQIYHLEGALNRLTGSILFAAFLFGGVLLYQGGDVLPGYILWAFAGLTLLWMAFFSRGHSPWR